MDIKLHPDGRVQVIEVVEDDPRLAEVLGASEFRLLPIDLDDAARVVTLPFHHRDPFDRMLVAQALNEELTIVSADPIFRKYGVKRIW